MDRKGKEEKSKGRKKVIKIIYLHRRDQEIPRTEGN